MDFILEFQKVDYRYPGAVSLALNNVSFGIPRGSITSIIGGTGSGKSTIIALAAGIFQEYGKIEQGKILPERNMEQNFRVGAVFQNPATQIHQLRVIDEIRSGPIYQGLPWDECVKRADQSLSNLLTKDYALRSPDKLSAGEVQRVTIAAAVAMDCEVLFFDEPFSFLDTRGRKDFTELLRNIQNQGITCVIVTHDLRQIEELVNWLIVIKKGKVVTQGIPAQILKEYPSDVLPVFSLPTQIKILSEWKESDSITWKIIADLLHKPGLPLFSKNTIEKKYSSVPEAKSLTFSNVNFAYNSSKIEIKDTSFSMNKGEIFALLGANGSGKSTIAKIAAGLLKPSSGQIVFENTDVTKIAASTRAKTIAYLFQQPDDMIFCSTVANEVALGPQTMKLNQIEQRTSEALKSVGLYEYQDRSPDTLSGGEKRLLCFATAFSQDAEIIILDEPECGLDKKYWKLVQQSILKMKESGKSSLLITHRIESLPFLCDRACIVERGEIVYEGSSLSAFQFVLKKEDIFDEEAEYMVNAYSKALESGCKNEDEMVEMVSMMIRKGQGN